MRKIIAAINIFVFTLALAVPAAAEDASGVEDVGLVLRLLAGYLKNDAQLQELAVRARLAEIARERAGLENGFDLTLSSGTMRLYSEPAGNADGGWVFSVEPKATLSFPALNNSGISVSAPVRLEGGGAAGGSIEDVKISLSTDIVSSAGKQRRVNLLRADRTALEARRAVSKRALSAEKEFYEALRGLYESAVQALTFEEDAYTKEIEFAMAQRQGYSTASVYYRTLQLEAADSHRSASEQRRSLERDTVEFARDCGIALGALPQTVPKPDAENLPEFGREDEKPRFAAIENAIWNSYIGALSRNADGRLTLSAQAGVTAGNTSLGNDTSADAGLTLDWNGISLSVESQIPVSGKEKTPAFTFSFTYNLNKQRLAPLSDAEKSLAAESEALALRTAERDWEKTVDSMRREREDILWETKRLYEQYELYRELSEETDEWFARGVVTESERRKAQANTERARLRLLAADTRTRILFIDWALNFAGD
ncbi:MAG: hypothetical protein LBJ86_02050 [Spirochaetaceae bacterium]|jgi:hypothetical protein|nr:hypothetical protein [Spirochaetaceae bacterium]